MQTKLFTDIFRDGKYPVSRLILGDEMDASLSKIFTKMHQPGEPGSADEGFAPLPYHWKGNAKTGTIGFCDFQIAPQSQPPSNHDEFTLKILAIGIEPEYRKKGFANTLINLVKEVGVSKGCYIIWHDNVQSDILQNKYRRLKLQEVGAHFVEFLK